MTKKKIILLIIFAVILGGIAAGLLLYNQPGFTGNRVANPDSYTLEIQRMHGTDRHTMALNAGDVLQIHFETEKARCTWRLLRRTERCFTPETAGKLEISP